MQRPIDSETNRSRYCSSPLLLRLFAVVAWVGGAVPVQAEQPDELPVNEPVFQVTAPRQNQLQITERFAKIVELESKIVRVDGFDPAIINVTALAPHQLRVQALAPGVTTLVVADENDQSFLIDVFVAGDVRHLQAYLSRLFPTAAVEAVAVRDSVVLRGWVTQPEHISEMVEVAEQFYPNVLNQMRVGGVQQVLLKVKVMEVQRGKLRRMGFNFLHISQNAFFGSHPGGLTPLAALNLPFGGPPGASVSAQALGAPSAAFGIVSDNHAFQGFVEALREESLLEVLAEPELVCTNGRPANLLAGGEFPFIIPQGIGPPGIEWKEFGVRLEAVPIILGNGRVRLELQPEVSDRDFTSAVEISGLTIPGLSTRRVNTQVEMNFGETFMLAGLLDGRRTAEARKIPFLGELPWIGAAFRRVRYDEGETELVIMVTPELVGPLDPTHIPFGGPGLFTDAPTDRELFRDGLLEVPRIADRCEGCVVPVQGFVGAEVPPPLPGMMAPEGMVPGAMPGPSGGFHTRPGDAPEAPRFEPGPAPTPALPEQQEWEAVPPSPPALEQQESVPPGAPEIDRPLGTPSPRGRGEDDRGATRPYRPASSSGRGAPVQAPAPSPPQEGWKPSAGNLEAEAGSGRPPSAPSRPGLIEPKPGLIAPSAVVR